MSSKKKGSRKQTSAISEAPPPITPIRAGGYHPRKSKPARFEHWNRVPLVSLNELIMLMLGNEPGTKIQEPSKLQKFNDLLQIAVRCQETGSLSKGNDDSHLISHQEAFNWAKSQSEPIPENWKPENPKTTHKEGLKSTLPQRRREEMLRAAIIMAEKDAPGSMRDVVFFMRKDSDSYPDCCSTSISDDDLIKSISQRGGGNPLECQEYKVALAQFRSDKADKADNIRHLPLVNPSKPK